MSHPEGIPVRKGGEEVNFRVTGELQARARQRARREGKSLSELARDALAEYVK